MNQTFFLFRSALLLLTVFQLTSCKKLIDKYFPGHGSGNETVEDYRIKRLGFTYRAAGAGEITTATVYYNQHNNPDSVIFDNTIGNDPSMVRGVYFVYNNSKKLTEVNYLRYYEGGYNRYAYDSTGRISSDTSRFIEVGAAEYSISYPSYDSKGRVISEEIYVYESGGFTYYDNPLHYSITYPYDSDGNLVRNRSPFDNIPVVYDDKINYLRTNKIWMFISRNYSQNNPDAVTTYTNFGLPLGFRNGVVISFLGWGDPYEIEYEKVD